MDIWVFLVVNYIPLPLIEMRFNLECIKWASNFDYCNNGLDIMQICVHIWSVYMFKQWYSASVDVKVAMVALDWRTATSKPTTKGSSNGAACSLVRARHGSALRNARHLNCIGRHRNKLHCVCFRGRATLSWAKFHWPAIISPPTL